MLQEWGMLQGVGVCGIVTYLACDKAKGHMAGGGDVAGTGDMWQGIGACDRGWLYMAGDGGMWQGLGICDKAGDMLQMVVACGRVWDHVTGVGHVVGGGDMC